MAAGAVAAGGSGAAGADRVAGRGWCAGQGHRGAGRGVQADGDRLEEALCRPRASAGWRIARSRAGRPVVDEVAVVLATLEPPPERLGVTHWSSRLLGAELGISHVWVGKIWRRWGLQPWRAETFKFSTDPELEAKVRDVVGLYLNPPDKASCSASTRSPRSRPWTGPRRSCRCGPGLPEKQTHDYVRHGTTTLFAALEVATGQVEQTPATAAPPPGVPALPQAGRQGLPAAQAAPRRATTTPPTSTPPCRLAGQEPADHPALHPDLGLLAEHGRDLLRRSSPARPSAAAASPASRTSSPPSSRSSTAGTNAATRSPGPRPPTTSSTTADPVKEHRLRDTSENAAFGSLPISPARTTAPDWFQMCPGRTCGRSAAT